MTATLHAGIFASTTGQRDDGGLFCHPRFRSKVRVHVRARIHLRSLAATALLLAAGPGHACTTCEKALSLSKQQLACLELLLPSALAEKADPVILSLLACAPSSAISATRNASTDPVLKPALDPAGEVKVAEKLLFLTKHQVRCLQGSMEVLKKQPGVPVTFDFSTCKK